MSSRDQIARVVPNKPIPAVGARFAAAMDRLEPVAFARHLAGRGHLVIACRIDQFLGSSQSRPAAVPRMITVAIAEGRGARAILR